MRVIQILPVFDIGGAEIMCESLTYQLKNMGHEVYVISLYTKNTEITERMKSKGIRLYFMDKKVGFDLKCILNIRSLIKLLKPDIVHTHLYSLKYAFFACLGLNNINIVHTIHSIATKDGNFISRIFNNIIFRLDWVVPVALSNSVRETIIREYRIRKEYIPIIYNGIELSSFSKDINIKEKKDTVNIIHVGRFSEAKNHHMIIEAAKEMKSRDINFQIRMYGIGPLFEDIKNEIIKFNLQNEVIMCGESYQISSELKKSDIFILPSKWEGLPLSVIEAMASGLPIICTDVGALREVITGNKICGILIKNNPTELANAIENLAKNQELRESLGKNAYENSKFYSSKCMAENYIKVYTGKMA